MDPGAITSLNVLNNNRLNFWKWWKDLERFGYKYNWQQEEDQIWFNHVMAIAESDFVVADPFSMINRNHFDRAKSKAASDNFDDIVYEKNHEICVGGYVLNGFWIKGKRHGIGGLSGPALAKKGIQYLAGNYKNGWLTGLAKAVMTDGLTIEGKFEKGKLTGPVTGRNDKGRLMLVGNFHNGNGVGPFWRKLEGDGFLYGTLDAMGRFYGDNNAFVYPDIETAIVGRFRCNDLIEGYACDVKTCAIVNGIILLEISNKRGPVFKKWHSTLTEIFCPPMQEEPLEIKCVRTKTSQIEGGGDGIFAARDLRAGETVAFYNGIRAKWGEVPPVRSYDYEIYVDWIREWGAKPDYMDMPAEYQSLKNYRATLGHKVNHSFRPNCKFHVCQHPVFGRIPKIVTLEDITANEELTCHYMMEMTEAETNDNYKWYLIEWEKHSLQMRKESTLNVHLNVQNQTESWEIVKEIVEGVLLDKVFKIDRTNYEVTTEDMALSLLQDEILNKMELSS